MQLPGSKTPNGSTPGLDYIEIFQILRQVWMSVPFGLRVKSSSRSLSGKLRSFSIPVVFTLAIVPAALHAQQATITSAELRGLPDAPGFQGVAPAPQATLATQAVTPSSAGSSSISGVVLDIGGAMVGGAKVTLIGPGDNEERVAASDSKGEFTFLGISPGNFKITVTSLGLEPFASSDIVLRAGETRELPQVVLAIATSSSDVRVTATEDDVAVAEIKAAEKQRVFGVIPNFYSSYIWNAAPLRPKLKYELAIRSVTDPVTFLGSAGTAGVEQALNTFPGYGSGPGAYAKRFGAAYTDTVLSRMLGSAIFPSFFHQDPRYFYKGKGTIPSRAVYAIERTFITRGDNGHSQFNYSHLLGNFATAGISTFYHAPGDRTASLAIRNGFIITGGNAAINLVREFLLNRLTSKLPDYPQGKQ